MDKTLGRVRVGMGLLRSLAIYHNPVSVLRWRRFYKTILKSGELVFDIGAHVGSRARAMRAAGAQVVAVEPQYPFSLFLRRTLPRDITVLEVAIGQEAAEMTMAVSSRHPTVSTLNGDFVTAGASAVGFEHVRWDREQPVSVITLDGLIERFGNPAYVKIDVEGYEIAVLAGLSRPVPLISVEYLPAYPHLAKALVGRLEALGLARFNVVEGESGAFLWPCWRDGEEVTAWLEQLDPTSKPGDLFARPIRN
ncbi:FkbM family methyltransferase [Tropicimonas aquimaris]|uniref:FkbM family methyltransferase n=1 Tax=Tropicimonas aquimaris TaxID=914152 RepID=A0ABW3IUL9_9RHOB